MLFPCLAAMSPALPGESSLGTRRLFAFRRVRPGPRRGAGPASDGHRGTRGRGRAVGHRREID